MYYGAYNEKGRLYLDKSYPPLGLGYIAAVLKKENYSVKLLDLVDTPFRDIERIIKNEKPQILGVSCNLTDYRWGSFKLVQIVKRVDPKIKVVMGGSHATYMYKQILTNFPVDAIVRFEGEYSFLDLVRAFETSANLRTVKGIAFKEGAEIIQTEDRPPIADLDSLPFPAYDLFDFDRYIHYASSLRFKGEKVSRLKSINIISSRGCPYSCQYCSISKFWRRQCRLRSATNVVDEMEMLAEKYGIRSFNFFDDLFTANENRVIELCKEIIKRKLNVCWECTTRVDLVSLEMLKWMKKAGCIRISYGVESGSDKVLKAINKTQTRNEIIKAFKITHDSGIKAFILLMIGNPNETEQSINETVELIRLVKPDKIRTNLTMVYPGTDLYERCKQMRFIDDNYWLTEMAAPVFTAEKSIKQLEKWESKIVFSYYLQRKQVLRLFEMMTYRKIFKNFREMMRLFGVGIDEWMEKIDHTLHRTLS